MKRTFWIALTVLVFFGALFIFVNYYSYLFSRRVIGRIIEVERVSEPSAIVGSVPMSQVFSFAVAVRESTGEIFTASSEDRQWAVAKRGMCVEALYYPYPPWNLQKSGTYFNARLIRLMECQGPALDATPTPDAKENSTQN